MATYEFLSLLKYISEVLHTIGKQNHQFSASAVELEFLRSERRLRSGKHFA